MIIDFLRNYSLTSGIPSVTISEQVLERVEHAKMLGVTISNNLRPGANMSITLSAKQGSVYMLGAICGSAQSMDCWHNGTN